MIDKARTIILRERRKMKGVPLSVICDKEEGQKRDMDCLLLNCWQDIVKIEINLIAIGIDISTSGITSRYVATSIDNTLKLFDSLDKKIIVQPSMHRCWWRQVTC